MGAPTFNWTGTSTHVGERIYYSSFNLSEVKYSVGDYVYLLPEEEGSALYIAKIRRAFENTAADDAQRLCIEVQWLERPSSMPDAFQARMHERELVESDLSDTNLVGCIDRKALVVVACSYDEALELISLEDRDSDWHFCSGIYETATGAFKPFPVMHKGMVPVGGLTSADGTGPSHDNGSTSSYARHSHSSKDNGYDEGDKLLHATKRRRGGADLMLGFADQPVADAYGVTTSDGLDDSPALMLTGTTVNPQALMEMLQRVQANGGPMPIASLAFPEPLPEEEAAAPAPAPPPALPPAPRHGRKSHAPQNAGGTQSGGAMRRTGVPGRVCAECGATTTPQWREGPQGPKTLCNACGVRYHRQNKARTNKHTPREPKPPPPAKAPARAQTAAKKRAGPTGSRQSARQAQKVAAGSRRGQLMDSDGEGGSGGSPFKSASRGRRARLDAFGRDEEEGGWDGYGQQEDELEVVQGMRKRGSLQRMQTSEAADVLQTFRMGGHSGMGRATHSSSPYDGSDGQLLSEPGMHSDLLPQLHMEGSPALAGEGQSHQRTSSPLIRNALRGRRADSTGRNQDSPAPLILAATAPVDALGALKHGVSAFKRSALVHPSLNLHIQGPAAAGTSNGNLDAGRRPKGSSVLSALPAHLQGQHPMQVTASGDSWHTSDSTEEVAYEPFRAAAATAAAASAGAATAAGAEGRALKLGALEDWVPELVGYGQLYEAIPTLLTSLPEEHAAQLVAAKQHVDAAAREAKAADAAVQAVSQVLGVKRQAAEDARRCADERVARLRNLMLSLSKQHGLAPGADTNKDGKPQSSAAVALGPRAAADGIKPEQGTAAARGAGTAGTAQRQQPQEQQPHQPHPGDGQLRQSSMDLLLPVDGQQQQPRQQQDADLMMEDADGAAQLLSDAGPTQLDMEAVIGADWQALASGADVAGHMAASNGNSSYSGLQAGADGLAVQQQQRQQQQLSKQQRAQDDVTYLQATNDILGMPQQPPAVGAGPESTPIAA